jgi:hypothetical protein
VRYLLSFSVCHASFRPSYRALRHARSFLMLADKADDLVKQYRASRSLASHHSRLTSPEQWQSLRLVEARYKDLAQLDTTILQTTQKTWRIFDIREDPQPSLAVYRDGRFLGLLDSDTLRAAAPCIVAHFDLLLQGQTTRTVDSALLDDVEELAGILIAHLVPFPPLRHLSHSFRLQPFLRFVKPPVVLPLLSTFRHYCKTVWIRNFAFTHRWSEAIRPFCDPLEDYLLAIQRAHTFQHGAELLDHRLRLLYLEAEIPKAENELHNELIEAILRWKERKGLVEEQRLKQA